MVRATAIGTTQSLTDRLQVGRKSKDLRHRPIPDIEPARSSVGRISRILHVPSLFSLSLVYGTVVAVTSSRDPRQLR